MNFVVNIMSFFRIVDDQIEPIHESDPEIIIDESSRSGATSGM
jgi:hypothetical protein